MAVQLFKTAKCPTAGATRSVDAEDVRLITGHCEFPACFDCFAIRAVFEDHMSATVAPSVLETYARNKVSSGDNGVSCRITRV